MRRFAEELQRFNREVEVRMATLQARYAALGDSWQDQEQIKFAEEFKQTMKALKKFYRNVRATDPLLAQESATDRRILNQR